MFKGSNLLFSKKINKITKLKGGINGNALLYGSRQMIGVHPFIISKTYIKLRKFLCSL